MEIEMRQYPRATQPHIPTLSAALVPLFPAGQGLHVRWNGTHVVIEAGNWTGVVDATVQSAVDAAAAWSDALDAKQQIDDLPKYLKAIVLLLVDELNAVRTAPTTVLPARTAAQAWTAIKQKVDQIS